VILRPKGLEPVNNCVTISNLAVRFKRSSGMLGPEKIVFRQNKLN